MEQGYEKRRVLRRSSVQFCVTAEEHIKNEMKHERHLTETSRLTSSWANLRLTGNDKTDYSDCGFSSPASSRSSPVGHRPNSFSGPLMISVTCSSSGGVSTTSVCESRPPVPVTSASGITTFSRSSSSYPSPVASPVSSRVQCYSPSVNLPSTFVAKKRTASVSSGGSASPLIFAGCRGKKRAYACLQSNVTSSTEVSRESSPEPPSNFFRFSKIPRSSEVSLATIPNFGSPTRDCSLCTPHVSTPSSPPPSALFAVRTSRNSPSTSSLPSLTHSTSSPRQPILPAHSSDFSHNELKSFSPSSFSCPESEVVFQQATAPVEENSTESSEK
ncbi:unnamed protein product [Hymenolepis diminuta]|uniref:Flocculation protein FLO11-like n=1 Tax=Hymenolepis diminuta TaxID=6216 RepID=A0A0R3SB89_HYMDI|nr:unnamed protein product [Hymenolepis diminuta]VUZ46247.1 unnamed protein product [Hymenolepis diminuta]